MRFSNDIKRRDRNRDLFTDLFKTLKDFKDNDISRDFKNDLFSAKSKDIKVF